MLQVPLFKRGNCGDLFSSLVVVVFRRAQHPEVYICAPLRRVLLRRLNRPRVFKHFSLSFIHREVRSGDESQPGRARITKVRLTKLKRMDQARYSDTAAL